MYARREIRRIKESNERRVRLACRRAASTCTYLLVEHGLGLTSESSLLRVVSALSLGEVGGFSRLVLGDLVDRMSSTFLTLAEGPAFFRDVNL